MAREYYALFARTFWASAKKRAVFSSLLVALFSLVVGASIFWVTNGFAAMTKEISTFIAFTLAPLGLVALGFIIYNLIRTPVKIHEEQSNEIKRLKDAWELRYVQANLEKDVFPNESKKIVGISIRNPLSPKLTDLHVELVDVLWIEQSGTKSLKTDNSPNHRFTDIESNEPETIMGGETVRVNIATINPLGELILIPYKRDGGNKLTRNVHLWASQAHRADFQIQVEITGYVDNRPICSEAFNPFIHSEPSHLVLVQVDHLPTVIHTEPVLTIRKDPNEEANQQASN